MRKHINRLKTCFLLSTLVFLVACGGGGDSSPISGGGGAGGGNAAGEAAEVTSFALADSGGATVSSVSAGTPTTVSFTVVDSSGTAVPGATGTFDLDVPVASSKSGAAGTGAQKSVANGSFTASGSGVVSITLSITDPTVAGEGTLTINLGDTATVTETITVVQVAGVPVSFTVALLQDEMDSNSEVTSISTTNPGFVVADLVDFNGDAATGEIISMSTSVGTLQPSSGSVLTDSLGRASAALVVGSAEPGAAGVITVSVDGLDDQSINFDIAGSGTTSTSGFDIVVGLYDSDVDLANLAGSNQVSAVSTVSSAFFVATVTDTISGLPASGQIVAVSSTVGNVTPSNGQILTNADGIAAAQIDSGTDDPGAAGTLTATIEDVNASLNFAIGSVDLSLGRDANDFVDPDDIDFVNGEIDVAATTDLAPNGTTVLTVVAVSTLDTATGFDTPLTINFSSSCESSGLAVIDTGITTVNGIAEATYQAAGCEGADEITATIAELSGVTATGSLTVDDSAANSIRFISATPTEIALQGTGGTGRQENSTLVFEVIDSAGDPISGQLVTAELSTTVGGITLTGGTNGLVTQTSLGNGQVSIIVNAGSIPTSVRVEASITLEDDTVISTVSDSLVISTGLPDDNSFEVVAETLNPGGDSNSGITSVITARASDAFNNPVPDGTTVNFITEYGSIGASCSTVGGSCTQTWSSGSPRSPDNENNTGVVQTIFNTACDLDGNGSPDQSFSGVPCLNDLSYEDTADLDGDVSITDYIVRNVKGARSTIMAYAIGEESFVDANGSGLYDWIDDGDGVYEVGEALEEFTDLPEAFIDHNDDGVFGNPLTGCDQYDGDGSVDATDTSEDTDQCRGARTGGEEEEFIDFIDNDSYDGDSDGDADNNSVGNGIYNGTLCHPDLEALATPLCSQDLVNVFDETTVLMAGNTAYAAVYSTAQAEAFRFSSGFSVYAGDAVAGGEDINHSGGETIQMVISDRYNGFLPIGTTISAEADNCTLTSLATTTVGNTSVNGFTVFNIGLRQDDAGEQDTGTVSVTVTVPDAGGGAGPQTFAFTCNDEIVPP